MEFKGTILLDASPALLAAFNKLADVFSTGKQAIAKVEGGADKTTPEPEPTVGPEPTAPLSISNSEVPSNVKYTKEQVKAAAAAKKDKRDEMKKILDEMGVKSIPALTEDQYEEFMQKISLL